MKRLIKTIVWLVALFAAGSLLLNWGYSTFMKVAYPLEYRELVTQEAAKQGVDPALVYSVIKAESNFDPKAKSYAGAMGLMQITPETFEWLQTKLREDVAYADEDLYTPQVNIRYGCKFLQILQDKYSERSTALSAYNAGIGTVNAWLKNPDISQDGATLGCIPYPETEKYVGAVLRNYKKYREIYEFE